MRLTTAVLLAATLAGAPAAATPVPPPPDPAPDSQALAAEVERLRAAVERLDVEVEAAIEDFNAAQSDLQEAQSAELAAQRASDSAAAQARQARSLAARRVRALYRSGPTTLAVTSAALEGRWDLAAVPETVRTARVLVRDDDTAVADLDAQVRESRRTTDSLVALSRRRVEAESEAADRRLEAERALAAQQELLERSRADLVAQVERERREAEALALAWALDAAAAEPGVTLPPATGPSDPAAIARLLEEALAQAPNPVTATAITAAASRLGRPYLWGATGPDRFDCSGLVVWSYGRAGIAVPRTTRQQYAGLTRIDPTQLLPGDLVFYASGPEPSSIHHVGMYIGHGLMIHSPRTGDVVKIGAVGRRPVFGAVRPVPGAA